MSFNLQLSKSENIKAMFSAPKWLPVCIQFRLPSKHPTPMAIQLHPQCLLGIQSILRNWTFLIFKQV